MSSKILGIDLGTNSLGITLRNPELGGDISNQIECFTSIIFNSSVTKDDKGNYVPYAADRTSHRSARRLYQARKYRIWATLRLLIAHGCCPLKEEELDRWARYDKAKGLKRQYPVDAEVFEQWVRLDFDCDGIPEYSSPYQLRAELMEREIDWSNPVDRYKFGRAMYHIAQRRGFKSSKGETIKESKEDAEVDAIDISDEMEKSEEKKSHLLSEYMIQHDLPTAGCAFAKMEREGIRVRNSKYQAVQSQYRKEVEEICKHQHIDELDPELYRGLISTKKDEGTIFYRRPLRPQKGSIGKCTLEPTKRRCPISHPDFEEFRALSFINNIKYKLNTEDSWHTLTVDEQQKLFEKKFTLQRITFKFKDIQDYLIRIHPDIQYFNYKDYATVTGNPVIHHIKKILGEDWHSSTIISEKERTNEKTGETHTISYNYKDIWHLAYCCDDGKKLKEYALNTMHLNEKQATELVKLWNVMQKGYASLSIKAIGNILPFLRKGMIYNEAVSVAKLPEILGEERWYKYQDQIITAYRNISSEINHLRPIYNITNTLISKYKSSNIENQQAYRNTEYQIDKNDSHDILNCILEYFSTRQWNNMTVQEQVKIIESVTNLYQQFFSSSTGDYYKLPSGYDNFKNYLIKLLPDINPNNFNALYHHSQIEIFPKEKQQLIDSNDGKKMLVYQLGKPDIGSIRNPAVMRALRLLRRSINHMLKEGLIDETTRIVVETTRDMNDANWRRAIDIYQNKRQAENKAIEKAIKEFWPVVSDSDIEKGRLLFEQFEFPQKDCFPEFKTREEKEKAEKFAGLIEKYKLWKQQKFQCLYTGNPIEIKKLFSDNYVDIDHTIPRSISFDNSLANRTICFSYFNRNVKQNRFPTELQNYNDIINRIKPWKERVTHIKEQIELWKANAKTAKTISYKDHCIQQQHLWQLDLDYWQKKLNTFTIQREDFNTGFRNSQLVDTGIITKYAFHYLKSVFDCVDVQKGEITSVFRRIIGIQSLDEKKDRSKHSHHAIDATVLSIIPMPNRRDKMIELFYRIEEAKKAGSDYSSTLEELHKLLKDCQIHGAEKLKDFIENRILVNHVSRDKTCSSSRRKMRVKGKIKFEDNEKKRPKYVQSDCIRGELHEATFLAAIKPPKYVYDEKNKTYHKKIDSNGNIIWEDTVYYSVRKELDKMVSGNSPWEWHNLESNIVNKELFSVIQKQFPEGTSLKEAIKQGIFDKNGNRIRHIRCFTGDKEPLQIKQQTYLSQKDYKRHFYAVNGTSAYMAIYWDGTIGSKRTYAVRSLFEIAKSKEINAGMLSVSACFEKELNGIKLFAIIRRGTRVIVFDKEELKKGDDISVIIEKLHDLDIDNLQKRLYTISNFGKDGVTVLIHHNEARFEKELGRGKTAIDIQNPNPRDRVRINSRYMLIENYHFMVDPLGKISFK